VRAPRQTDSGVTRGGFLLKGVLALAAAGGAGAVGPFVARSLAATGRADAEGLSFMITMEYLQADFYAGALILPLTIEHRALVEQLRLQEGQHLGALNGAVRTLGGDPPSKPRFRLPDHEDEASFLRLAQALEDLGVSAYNGVVAALESREILAQTATIVQVEARHAAAVRLARGQRPSPDAFDAPLQRSQAIANLRPLMRPG
jgi:ferritin-like protein